MELLQQRIRERAELQEALDEEGDPSPTKHAAPSPLPPGSILQSHLHEKRVGQRGLVFMFFFPPPIGSIRSAASQRARG